MASRNINMVQSTNLREVAVMDFYQAMKDILTEISAIIYPDAPLTTIVRSMQPAFTDFDNAVRPAQSSPHTLALLDLDNQRDNLLVGAGDVAEAYQRMNNAAAQAASRTLMSYINTYRNADRLPYREETAAITNLLQDLRKPDAVAALVQVPLQAWITALGAVNTQFETLYNTRRTDTYVPETGLVKKYRQVLQGLLADFGERLNALMLIATAPIANYDKAGAAVNRIVQKTKDDYRRSGGSQTPAPPTP